MSPPSIRRCYHSCKSFPGPTDSERQTRITHSPTPSARSRYTDTQRPHRQLHTPSCVWTYTPIAALQKQPCSQTRPQRCSPLWREIPIVTHRTAVSWGLARARHTEEHAAPHRDMPPTHKPQMWAQVNSIMGSSEITLPLPTHSFIHSINQPIFVKHLPCARHYSRLWGPSCGQNKDPCPRGVDTLVGLTGSKQIHI